MLSVLGKEVFGTQGIDWFLGKLLILMVLSSAAASTLTTILPTARTTLAMAAYRSIPSQFARIHRKYLTPTWSTVGMALVSMGFFGLMTLISENVLSDTISALGLMIAFYYGLTGFDVRLVVPQGSAERWTGPSAEGDTAGPRGARPGRFLRLRCL